MSEKTFEDLGLSPEVLGALKACGYETPTPIQAKAIPHILMGRDLVGLAQTGTGKTAGFTLPMIEILAGGRARARMPRSLVLAPTRELAAQVAESFDRYAGGHNLTHALLIGGTSMGDQIRALESGVDVLIAAPGRLLDLFERGKILLTDIKVLVIDEADRMMDMGFIPDIERIVSLLPRRRQTLLFSATMPPEIRRLSKKFLDDPKDVSVDPPASPAETVEQFLVQVGPRSKKPGLLRILEREGVESAFIFCNRKRDIDPLAKHLRDKGYAASALHGDMDQGARTKTLAAFKAGEVKLLVCSDVAGRGIDVSDVPHVVNYDLPFHADDYVHRIGRTGRAGATGRAWSLMTASDGGLLEAIEKKIGRAVPRVDDKTGRPLDGSAEKGETKPEPAPKAKELPKPKPAPEKAEEGPEAETAEDRPKRRRRSRGGRGRRRSEDADESAPEAEQEQPERKERPAMSARPARAPRESSGVKGFGDAMPGFFGITGTIDPEDGDEA